MIVLDIFIMIILAAIPFLILESKRRSGGLNLKDIGAIEWSMNSVFAILFALTYYFFRYLHSPWVALFNPLHLYALIFTFMLPFILAYFCKGTNKAKLVAVVMSLIMLLSPITRPFFLPMVRESMSTVYDWVMAIPLNLCNISAIVYIIGILLDNKTIKNYMITFGLFGGLINNVQIFNTTKGTFWFYLTWESYFVHALIVIVPIFMLLTNQIKPSVKHASINIVWIFILYIVSGFILNPLWSTNFSFTQPIPFTQNLLPIMDKPLIIFDNPVDPLYMLALLVLIFAFAVILYGIAKALYKYVRPKFSTL